MPQKSVPGSSDLQSEKNTTAQGDGREIDRRKKGPAEAGTPKIPAGTVAGLAAPQSSGAPNRRPRGVAGPPGGLGAGAWWAILAALVTLFALLFWLATEPFEIAFGNLGLGGGEEKAPVEELAEPVPVQEVNDPARVEQPREPSWTLLDVEGAVQSMAPQITELIEEGRAELPEFKALSSRDRTRSARARERFTAWAQIWRNRVDRLVDQMPPPSACSVHAAMDPACRSLRSILEEIDTVAEAAGLEDAEARLEAAAESLDLFLNPPEPELETDGENGEEIGEEGDSEGSFGRGDAETADQDPA